MKLLISLVLCLAGPPGKAAEASVAGAALQGEDNRSSPAPEEDRRLGPGDRITYRVLEDQDEPRSLTITDSGELEVPYYGLIQAAGKTRRQLEQEIRQSLEQKLYHRATVVLAVERVDRARTTGKVYVTGQVRNKGGFDIPAGEAVTVSKAILIAGGFSDFSDKRNVKLVRKTAGQTKTFKVNVHEIWEKGKLDKDLPVEPNDLIIVPARLINY